MVEHDEKIVFFTSCVFLASKSSQLIIYNIILVVHSIMRVCVCVEGDFELSFQLHLIGLIFICL